MSVRRFDAHQHRKPEKLANGFLKADAVLSRVGVFTYHLGDGTTRRELRLPEEVFNADSMKTFEMLPVTDDHPPEAVTATNATKYQRGAVGTDIRRDGDLLCASVMITDSKLVAAITSAKKDQLSNGYDCDLEMTAGRHDTYGEYDAIQRNIHGNHVAVVKAARAGPVARVRMDAADGVQHADMIRHEGGKFVLYSQDGTKKLGTHPTLAAAQQQEAAVRASQHADDGEEAGPGSQPGPILPLTPPSITGEDERPSTTVVPPSLAPGGALPPEEPDEDDAVQPISSAPVQPGNEPASEPPPMKITIDGIAYEPEQVPAILERRDATSKAAHTAEVASLTKARTDAETALAAAKAETEKATGRADGLKAELDKATKARADAESPAKIQELVNARVAIITKARAVLGSEAKLDELDEKGIQAEVLKKLSPALKLDGKSPDYVQARFDTAIEAFDAENPGMAQLRAATAPGVHADTEDELDGESARAALAKRAEQAYRTPSRHSRVTPKAS